MATCSFIFCEKWRWNRKQAPKIPKGTAPFTDSSPLSSHFSLPRALRNFRKLRHKIAVIIFIILAQQGLLRIRKGIF